MSPFLETYNKDFKVQNGFLFNISLILFLFLGYKSKSKYFFSILATQLFILLIIIYPFGRNFILQPFFNLAQFPYRFLSLFSLFGTIIIIITLRYIICKINKNKNIFKFFICLLVIFYSIIDIKPYLRTPDFDTDFQKVYSINEISDTDYFFGYANVMYLFYNNKIDPYIPLTDPKFLIKRSKFNNAANQHFTIDLTNYSSIENFKGFLDFEFMYYPGLQNINIYIDGKKYPNLTLLFSKSPIFISNIIEEQIFYIYFLRLVNLPSKGILTVDVHFEGMPLANFLSTLSFYLFIALIIILKILKLKKIRLSSQKNNYLGLISETKAL
ncbi:MAG: hypothetical protein LBV23_10505 [Deltaproteobacteria bacterium]|nr:hypothetical protein [Deltaproteobacteria bacterium]